MRICEKSDGAIIFYKEESKMKGNFKKGVVVVLSLALVFAGSNMGNTKNNIKADEVKSEGNLADKLTGTWSYWDGSKDVVQSNAMLLDKLPTRANKGVTRWTTDNYDANTGALDIGGFATSTMWQYSNSKFGNSLYAIPLSYRPNSGGIFVTKPSTVRIDTTMLQQQPEDGSLTDFNLGTDYILDSSKGDKVTEWSTDIVMEKKDDPSTYMKVIMTQGSPFTFVELKGSTKANLLRKRTTLPSAISYYNGSSIEDSTMLVLRTFDNQDQATGYSQYDYYALYLPEGTTVSQAGNSGVNGIGQLIFDLPSDRTYYTFSWLCESMDQNDDAAKKIAEKYQDYAYNFITDTSTSFTYDKTTSTITTEYKYEFDKKAESKKDGTIMGILPHQYKNMSGYTFLDNVARTIRGNMKYLEGDKYVTTLKYTGILPSMPGIDLYDNSTLKGYVEDFMTDYGPADTAVTKEDYSVNTYDTGKKMNRAIQVMEAAEACGDTEDADKLLKGLEAELEDWFTWTGEDDEKYFYYDKEVGSLFGFPQAYYTVDGMTDHHFHYGYFIQAAAQVTLRNPSFAKKYGNIINELIGDIATDTQNSPDSRYPFLRYFSTWEGHSWASGHANFADGNNQESSSEATNAWAALILYGQATNNEKLTELGIYLYETEISSIYNYWFDIDGDVLDSTYKQTSTVDSSLPKYIQASMIWGGKYTYATWWTAEPLQIQGINILPMTSASFYYAANKDYIINNWKTANDNEKSYTGDDKNEKRWNEIWSEYLAIADPEKAEKYFDTECDPEAGESKAHAFHYIMSLQKAGTPDLSVTSDTALSSVFKNEDDERTYVVYNAEDTEKTVTFSDGTTVVAKPHEMTTMSDSTDQPVGKSTYKVEHYVSDGNGGYVLFQTDTKVAKVGNEVTAEPKTFAGYKVNLQTEGTVEKGVVSEDGSLVLKLYYDVYTEKPTTPAEDNSKYTKLGTSDGLDISYYILQDDFGIAVKLLDAGNTFYIEYSGVYNKDNTKGYLNKNETAGNVYGGVYKFNPNTLNKDAYNTVKLQSNGKNVYIIIKYGNPTEAPDISDYEGEVETPDPKLPTEATGLALGNPKYNVLMVLFNDADKTKEQTYNVYVDGEKKLSEVKAGMHTIEKIGAGRVTVKVTAVYNNKESEGVSGTVKITGKVVEKPTEAPTEKPTEKPTVDSTNKPTERPSETTAKQDGVSTVQSTTKAQGVKKTTVKPSVKLGRTKVKKAVIKKKAATKINISFKKIKGATKYRIQISKTKKFKKVLIKKTVKKVSFTFKNKKLKKYRKLYVRVKAVGALKWSKPKKVKFK